MRQGIRQLLMVSAAAATAALVALQVAPVQASRRPHCARLVRQMVIPDLNDLAGHE